MSVLAPHIPNDVDPMWIAFIDAHKSGWFLEATGELYRGFPITADDHVLEVGCGSEGVFTRFCAKRCSHITFTDIEPDFIKAVTGMLESQELPATYKGIVCDSDPLLVPDECATKITCQEVLEHVRDPETVMKELVRAGKPGALYLLTVPGEQGEKLQIPFAPPRYFKHPNHIRIFSKDAFVSLVENAGLEVVSYSGYGFFWVFWMCMNWAIEAQKNVGKDISEIPVRDTIVPPFDASIQNWATLWVKLMSTPKGLAFKHGMDSLLPKSQIIVARKPA